MSGMVDGKFEHGGGISEEIKHCTFCREYLPHTPRPICIFHSSSKLLLIGQAPGRKVHETGIPFDDPSGDQLREWLQMDRKQFYDPGLLSIVPMGFCYPGKGKSGDLPPRKECAPLWHGPILSLLKNTRLTLLVGQYAQRYYLGKKMKKNLTETVRNYREYLPAYFPLPHPSPRNRIWLARNSWFSKDVLPVLQDTIQSVIH